MDEMRRSLPSDIPLFTDLAFRTAIDTLLHSAGLICRRVDVVPPSRGCLSFFSAQPTNFDKRSVLRGTCESKR